jgi:hypothetical protein
MIYISIIAFLILIIMALSGFILVLLTQKARTQTAQQMPVWWPNPNNYSEHYDTQNPIHKAVLLYREQRRCDDHSVIKGPETIRLKNPDGTYRYRNYLCRDRYQEQCIDDGSFDTYYYEWCEDECGNQIFIE